MAVAMVYTIVADVVPVAERTDMFFRLVALVLVFNVIFNPISAWLLEYDPWLSMWIGFGFMVFGTLCILLIPETMHLRRKDDDERHDENEQADGERKGVLKQAWFSIKNDMQHVWRFIFASKSIMMLMFSVALFVPTRITLTGVMLQYMSKRFDWSWSKVSRSQILWYKLLTHDRLHIYQQSALLRQLFAISSSYQSHQSLSTSLLATSHALSQETFCLPVSPSQS